MMNAKIIIAAVLAGLIACSDSTPPQAVEKTIPDLETVEVTETAVETETTFDGVIEAINQATVSAQTSGRVTELPFDVGDYVEKGQVIARFTDAEQRARLDSVEAAVAVARAQFEDAQTQYDRIVEIYEKGLVARAEYDHAKTQLKTARANLDAAESSLREARESVEHTVVKAPYSGIVLSREVDVGEMVAPGTQLLSGLSLEQLRAVVEIPQQHIGPLRLHKKARVLLPDGSYVEGNDIRIPPGADASTHTFRVLVNLSVEDQEIFPGTLVKVAFVSGTEERLLVPASAVARRGEVTAVYVVGPENSIEFRYVRLGSMTPDSQFPVLSGLSAGERIAFDPVAAAKAYRNRYERKEQGEE